jgi:hypothetical protein
VWSGRLVSPFGFSCRHHHQAAKRSRFGDSSPTQPTLVPEDLGRICTSTVLLSLPDSERRNAGETHFGLAVAPVSGSRTPRLRHYFHLSSTSRANGWDWTATRSRLSVWIPTLPFLRVFDVCHSMRFGAGWHMPPEEGPNKLLISGNGDTCSNQNVCPLRSRQPRVWLH